jgi:hypothetical protein
VHLSNGFGGTSGAEISQIKPIDYTPESYTTSVRYIHYQLGSDLNTGFERSKPLVSLANATSLTQDAYSVFVLLAGHKETISLTPVQINQYGMLIGEGDGDQIPRLDNYGDYSLMNGAMGYCENVIFGQALPRTSGLQPYKSKILMPFGGEFKNCKFEFGDYDQSASCGISMTGSGILDGNASFRFINCTFNQVGITVSAQAAIMVVPDTTYSLPILIMDNCVFDGGELGWANGKAFRIYNDGRISYLRATNIYLYNGSDLDLTSTSVTFPQGSAPGLVNVVYSTGNSKIIR